MNPSTTRSRRRTEAWVACALALSLAGSASAHEPRPQQLAFTPPAPGTYRLERIMQAPDGKVIDVRHRPGTLAAYTQGKVTLLSLMYTSCSDERGCPLAFYSIVTIRRDLEKNPAARGKVQVVSLSFDPEHDTPEVMRAYGGSHAKDGAAVPWHFVTAASRRELAPMLSGFDQDVSRPRDGGNKELSHVLKLFLIDRDGWVREIYTSAYLAPKMVLNDIQTLLMEDRSIGN